MQNYLSSLFQAIFDHPAIGASINDNENRFLRVNTKFAQLLGYDVAEMLGKTPMDFTWTSDLDRTRSFHKDLIDYKGDAKNGEYEKRYIKKDGSLLWAKVIAKQILNPINSKETITLALIEDITSQKTTQAKAEFDQLQLQMILDTSNLGIWCVDTSWKITFSNESLQKILGYSHDEILSLNLKDITHPEDFKETTSQFGPTKPGESYQAIRRYLRADGSYVWTKLTVSKFPENYKNLYGLAIVEDITRQKEAETLIQSQQIKIISSAKMAALGEMAGGMAHEINNPLSVIIGKIAQIQRRVQDEQFDRVVVLHDLKKVHETAERIASIVKGLRVFSRDAETDPLVEVELDTVVQDAVALCREKFKAHGVALTIRVPTNQKLCCRPTQLMQILLNLFSNSLDVISGLVEKWIVVESIEHAGKLVISITDSGNGIAPAIVEKMMQPFFTTKEVGKGTGLGLSISTGIALQHKGTLTFDSTCKNTRFLLTLPKDQA